MKSHSEGCRYTCRTYTVLKLFPRGLPDPGPLTLLFLSDLENVKTRKKLMYDLYIVLVHLLPPSLRFYKYSNYSNLLKFRPPPLFTPI